MKGRHLLALLCVLASLLVPGTTSANAAVSAQSRVWAFDLAEQVHVAGQRALTLELQWGSALAEYDCASSSLLAATGADDLARVFHHTFDDALESSQRTGLRPGSYATPTDGLSPLQAHIELALPPNGARNAVLQIDVQGLRSAGYQIPEVTRVRGQFGLPGGGYEMQFPYAIPPEFITVVEP